MTQQRESYEELKKRQTTANSIPIHKPSPAELAAADADEILKEKDKESEFELLHRTISHGFQMLKVLQNLDNEAKQYPAYTGIIGQSAGALRTKLFELMAHEHKNVEDLINE